MHAQLKKSKIYTVSDCTLVCAL